MPGRIVPAALLVSLMIAAPASADVFTFSTNGPDGLMAMASRPSDAGKVEIEAADDFIVNSPVQINGATFTGLLTGNATPADVSRVIVEIYRVFPKDSTDPPSGNVPTRANSPSDVEFLDRQTGNGNLSFTTSVLNGAFTAQNSVLNGINKKPNQNTLGEGPVRGTEVQFNVTFTTPITLPADHYFFVPQVGLSTADNFFWLSAPKPIVPPGTPFSPDLQAWIRNEPLQPDWLRVGTDIVGGNPAPQFNAAFSLDGVGVPEPSSLVLLGTGTVVLLGGLSRRFRRQGA
ncbi:MAG TPA: PEP-CTERM sorting domain-containing protein [Isosphaeraceae bacterium]|nr:PEP-CTERM sorting domain-containing protein [Isosphaeraceae bacterium]